MKRNKTYIQVAGLRTVKDALLCVECGVDIIGLLVGQMHTSDDFISKETAKQIKASLPKNIKTTLITHLENADEIIPLIRFIGVNYVQLHSNIAENEVQKIKNALPKIKLIRVIHILQDGKILTKLDKIKYVDYFFTDSINLSTNQVGGTGITHNLETDKHLVETLTKPVFIAGGLTPENVRSAIEFCKPYGVDVNSGCRAKEGGRDRKKTQKFVDEVKKANTTF